MVGESGSVMDQERARSGIRGEIQDCEMCCWAGIGNVDAGGWRMVRRFE
jgi:hypothetical protein